MWKLIALLAPIPFVTYQALSKALPKTISPFFTNGIASIVGAILMLSIYYLGPKEDLLPTISGRSWLLIILIGICISLGNYFIIKAFSLGAEQSTFTAIFNPSYILIGLLVGLLVWHEKINTTQLTGTFIAIIGIILIAYGSRN